MSTQIPIYHSSGIGRIQGNIGRLFDNWLSPPSNKDIHLPDDREVQVEDWNGSSANYKRLSLAPKSLTEVSINRKALQQILTERSEHPIFSRLEECYPTSAQWFFFGPKGEVKGPFGANEMDKFYESGFFEQSTLISNADSDSESFRYLTFWLKKYYIFHVLQTKLVKKHRCSESSRTTQKTDLDDRQTMGSDRSIIDQHTEQAKITPSNELVFLNEVCQLAASEETDNDEEMVTRDRSHTLF